MADAPILKIPVDTSEFDTFIAKFEAYKEEAKNTPDPFARANAGMYQAAEASQAMQTSFNEFARASSSSRMTGTQSFSSQFARNMNEASKDTKETGLNLEKSNKAFLAMTRNWSALRSIGKTGFGIVGVAAGVAGAAAATASDLAADNRRNRELGLAPGAVPAFNNDFEKFGLSDSDIGRVRDASTTVADWKTFALAGLNPQQAQNMDPAELTAYMNKWSGGLVREWKANGQPLDTMSKAYGLDKLFGTDQLRLAGSYSDEEHDQAFAQYQSDTPRFAVDQKAEDKATAQQREWNNTWTGIKRDFESAFMTLTPELTKLGTEFGKLVDAFTRSPEIKKDLDDFADDLQQLDKFLHFAHRVNSDPKNQPDAAAAESVHQFAQTVWKGFGQSYRDMRAYLGYPVADSASDGAPSDLAAYKHFTDLAEAKYQLPSGLQSLQMGIESRYNPNAVNKDTGAQGLMQFMPATSRDMHIDPFDPSQAIDAGGRLLRKFSDIYGSLGKGLAAYDGDTHISADAKKYKSWLMGAKPETLNYLRPFSDAGYDLGLSDEEKKFLTAHSKAFKGAAKDASLSASTPRINDDDIKIVELPKVPPSTQASQQAPDLTGVDWFRALFREGGGAQFFNNSNNNSSKASDFQTRPAQVTVKVSTPAGASTNIATNSIPH